MDCNDREEKSDLGECEGEKKSAVMNNETLFCRENTRPDININIERAGHVTIGDKNTIVYEDGYPGISKDNQVKTAEASVKKLGSENKKEKFAAESQTNYTSDKGEVEKIQSSRNFPKYHRRRKWKRSENRTLESALATVLNCSAIQVTNDNLEQLTDIRVPFLQVVRPSSDEEDSFEDRRSSNLTKDKHIINIEAGIFQFGRSNDIFTKPSRARCSLNTGRHEHLKHNRKPQDVIRRPGENAKFPKRVKKIDHIMEMLHKQRDSGAWEQFEETASQLLDKNANDTDFCIWVLLEQSIASNYQKNLKRAESLAQEALSKVPQASQAMVDVYQGRAYYCLSCVFKRTNALEKAFENIELSEKYLAQTDSVRDKAFLAYEKGCVLQGLALNCDSDIPSRQNQLNEAKQSFKQCIRLCKQMYEEGKQTYLNKHIFAMMKIAMLLLDCRTKFGRSRQVSPENVEKAKKYLNRIESNEELWKRVANSQIARVQFELAQADYFFRKVSYRKAEEHVSYAASLAIDGGFNTEVEPAHERLADIRERLGWTTLESQTPVVESEL